MSLYIKDRIYQETATEGTGKLTLTNVKEGYQGFISLPNGSTTYYCITNGEAWEVGQGQYVNDGTNTLTRTLLSSSTKALLDLKGNSSVFCTYPAEKAVLLNFDGNIFLPNANIQGQKFIGDGSSLTGIPTFDNTYNKTEIDSQQNAQDVQINTKISEAPDDGETYARNNKTWVSISDSSGIPDAPVDGLQYGRQDGEWTEVEVSDDVYTKEEIDAQQKVQDDDIVENNDDIARQQIEISNQQTSIDKNTSDIDTDSGRIATNATNISTNTGNISTNTGNISSNTTAIESNTDAIDLNSAEIVTNSGNITSNTTAIGTLSGQVGQNSEDIAELQDSIFFTSAYSADYPDSPNRDPEDGNMYLQNFAMFTYGYASATQIFCSKTDESGNVRQFTAVKPGDSIVLNEVDSPNYGRYELTSVEDVSDSYVVMNVVPKLGQGTIITGAKVAFQAFPKVGLWDKNDTNGYGTYPNNIEIGGGIDVGSAANGKVSNTMLGRNASGQNTAASAINNVSVGYNAFAKMSGAKDSVAIGCQAMKTMVSGSNNTAIGSKALELNPDGKSNVAIGAFAGATLTGGDNNILIGDNATPSSPEVSNEITLGNNDITTTRLKGNVLVGDTTWDGGPTTGLAIQASSSDASPFAMYIKNSDDTEILDVRCNGDTAIAGGLSVGKTTTMSDNLTINTGYLQITDISSNASTPNMVITESGVVYKSTSAFYSTKEVDGLVNAKDAIINKLTERLDDLELKFKALK